MKEYEIFVSISYLTDGGSREHNCFHEYVNANTPASAKRALKATLKEYGYKGLKIESMDEPIEVI